MNPKVFALPVVVALAVLIGSQMFAPTQPQAQQATWDVTTLAVPTTDMPSSAPNANTIATGPGYRPASQTACVCENCNCESLERRVAVLEQKVSQYGSARQTASQGSSGVSTIAGTAGLPYGAVVVSERIVSSSPIATTTRSGVLARTVTRSIQAAPQTCRIVNGRMVCQ